jgi:hypothetical protein
MPPSHAAVQLTAIAMLVQIAAVGSSTVRRAAPATGAVSGVVHDSTAGAPLAGAIVQLVGEDSVASVARNTISDSSGHFFLDSIPDGRYLIGFLHDRLDSIGIQPPLREITVRAGRTVRTALAIPSARRLRAAVCGPLMTRNNRSDSGAVVLGYARDAHTRAPLDRARVTMRWIQIAFTSGGVQRTVPELVAYTGVDGWFALCNVPSGGAVSIVATQGTDSTVTLDVVIPENGFLRRDFFVARAGSVSQLPTGAPPRDSLLSLLGAPATVAARDVGGILRGRVVASDTDRGVANAWVSVRNGPQTRANENGEWVLVQVPEGTGMLEVRALGFYPTNRPVDVVAGATPVRVALSTFKAVLDTVKVRSKRELDARYASFNFRRRSSGSGRFLTADDIQRRAPIFFSEIFRTIGGISLDPTPGGTVLRSRSILGDRCAPNVYLNNMWLGRITGEEIDAMVAPNDVYGVEVHPGGTEPPEFTRDPFGGWSCGAVVIWSKR